MNHHLILFGASGGIATALYHRLHRMSWNITCVTRKSDLPDRDSKQDRIVQADATTESGVKTAFDQSIQAFGTPTAVVNCLGNVMLKPLHRTSAVEFSDLMRLHVFSSFLILREAFGCMEENGSIALISSVAATTGLPNHEAIAAAKGALEGLVRSSAATYAPKRIRVNAVAPGLTETPSTTHLCKGSVRKISEKMHPLGRIGAPRDVASALAWLLDPEQSWVTGQVLHVDGGLGRLRSPHT
jgi:NAD(P)-dependent dehydrogenase (short-subunit alcohol dehydrogenase family)